MLSYHECNKCRARLRPSRRRNALEFIISPLVLPYRCSICDRRQFKFRFVNINPSSADELDTEDEGTPGRSRESVRVTDAGKLQIDNDRSSNH